MCCANERGASSLYRLFCLLECSTLVTHRAHWKSLFAYTGFKLRQVYSGFCHMVSLH